jgi:hypothetical protein
LFSDVPSSPTIQLALDDVMNGGASEGAFGEVPGSHVVSYSAGKHHLLCAQEIDHRGCFIHTVASLAFILYDVLLTFNDEVSEVFGRVTARI